MRKTKVPIEPDEQSGLSPLENGDRSGGTRAPDGSPFHTIIERLGEHIGTDFSNYKPAVLRRQLENRRTSLGIPAGDYIKLIDKDPRELNELFRATFTGVSRFFHDRESFVRFERLIGKILKSKPEADQIRIWVPGCANGEEACSIAILVHGLLKGRVDKHRIRIFATDIDKQALSRARSGIFTRRSIRNLPRDTVGRYFLQKDGHFELIGPIRSMVLFSAHDLTRDVPFLKMDLISCRNLLRYFTPSMRGKIAKSFQYSLNPEGYLFLGKSETAGASSDMFRVVDGKNKIFQRKNGRNPCSGWEGATTGDLELRSAKMELQIAHAELSDAQSRLIVSENTTRSVFNTASVGICITDHEGRFVDVNDEYCRIYGYERKELLGQPFTMMAAGEYGEPMRKLHEDFIPGVAKPPSEFNVVDKNGRHMTISLSEQLLVQPDGRRFKIASVRDITSDRFNQEHLEVLSGNLPVAIFRYKIHPDGREELMFLSEGSKLLWGLDPQTCMQDPRLIWDMYHPDDLPKTKRSIEESARKLTTWRAEWRVKHPDLGLRWHRGIGSPSRSLDGGTVWDSLILDITQEKEDELGLKQALGELSERVKELDCLYRISNLNEHDLSVDELLDQAAGILPAGFMHNEVAEAAIKFNRRLHPTGGYRHQKCRIKAQSRRIRDRPLEIRVAYRKSMGSDDPFLREERKLLDAVAELLTMKIAQIESRMALRESEETYRRLFDESPLPKLIFDVESGRIIDVNKTAIKFYGYSRKAFLGQSGKSLPARSGIHSLGQALDDLVHSDKSLELGEFTQQKNAGTEVIVQAFGHRIQRKGRSCLIVICLDITEQTKSMKLLLDSEDKLRQAVSVAKLGYWQLHPNGTDLHWSDEVYKIWGRSPEDFKVDYASFYETIHPDDRFQFEADRWATLNEEKEYDFEHRIILPDGSVRWVHEKGNLRQNEEGAPFCFAGTVQDITYRKEHEEALKKLNAELEQHARELSASNAELEQFAYVASHDLQEPLRMVTSFLTQLDKKYGDRLDQKAHRYIDFAVDGARRMREIILDLLEYSRVGKHSDNLKTVDLDELVDEVLILNRRSIEDSQAKITRSELPCIRSYRAPLLRVFQNLVSNALKYHREGVPPEIRISSERVDGFCKFCVQDNGIGIEKEYRDRIFTIFQRLHTRDKYDGTGMGLAIVKKIIENLGGTVWVESREDEGSSFYFTIADNSTS